MPEGGNHYGFGAVDIGAPAPAMPRADELARQATLAAASLVSSGWTPQCGAEALMMSLDAARCGFPLDPAAFALHPRPLSIPAALNMQMTLNRMKESMPPATKEHWASVAAMLTATSRMTSPEHEPELPPLPPLDPLACFTPPLSAATSTVYNTPGREGKGGGDVSPFSLESSREGKTAGGDVSPFQLEPAAKPEPVKPEPQLPVMVKAPLVPDAPVLAKSEPSSASNLLDLADDECDAFLKTLLAL